VILPAGKEVACQELRAQRLRHALKLSAVSSLGKDLLFPRNEGIKVRDSGLLIRFVIRRDLFRGRVPVRPSFHPRK